MILSGVSAVVWFCRAGVGFRMGGFGPRLEVIEGIEVVKSVAGCGLAASGMGLRRCCIRGAEGALAAAPGPVDVLEEVECPAERVAGLLLGAGSLSILKPQP